MIIRGNGLVGKKICCKLGAENDFYSLKLETETKTYFLRHTKAGNLNKKMVFVRGLSLSENLKIYKLPYEPNSARSMA